MCFLAPSGKLCTVDVTCYVCAVQVIVRKDNKGLLGADWHLQSVEVWHPLLKKRYFFIVNDWLKVGM